VPLRPSSPLELLAPVSRATTATIQLPRRGAGPVRAVAQRLLIAIGVLLLIAVVVWLDRDGYRDLDGKVSFLDAVYYATVTASTTGYGDVTPLSDRARLVNILIVTPLRVLFLIVLVGTTLEVLTERTREHVRQNRWRSSLRDHVIVVGYGTKGRSAVRALLEDGWDKAKIVAIDVEATNLANAADDDIASVSGDATRSEVLRRAGVDTAARVIVALPRDDTAVLTTLTVRGANARAHIVAACREAENAPLLRSSGADGVVVSSAAAGRLLGLSSTSPATGAVVEDLLVPGSGLDLIERAVTRDEVGTSLKDCPEQVLGVVRGGEVLHFYHPDADPLRADDRLVVVPRLSAARGGT
jgi:voltage-gated potassium channel